MQPKAYHNNGKITSSKRKYRASSRTFARPAKATRSRIHEPTVTVVESAVMPATVGTRISSLNSRNKKQKFSTKTSRIFSTSLLRRLCLTSTTATNSPFVINMLYSVLFPRRPAVTVGANVGKIQTANARRKAR